LGENYEAFVSSKDFGKSNYIAEQVSHHPPVSALHLWNEQENVTFDSNITFNVRFGGNYVNVGLLGTVTIGFHDRGEIIESNKFVPDMLVKNVIWGTKRIFWVGEVNLVSSKSGLSAIIAFRESNNENTIRATITDTKTEQVLYELDGKCSGEIYLIDKRRGNEKKLLIDVDRKLLRCFLMICVYVCFFRFSFSFFMQLQRNQRFSFPLRKSVIQ
jgi:hypothetical protein